MMEEDQPPKRDRQQEEQQKQQLQQYDTFLYKFQQQIIDAWKPVPYTSNNVILYAVLAAVCIGLGLALILTAPSTPEIQERIDQGCSSGSNCSITFSLSQKLTQPVYLYYGLTQYHQNHRQYLKYFSASQLQDGTQIDKTTAQADCGSAMSTNTQLGYTTSATGASLTGSAVAWPCGPRAKSYYALRPQLQTYDLQYSNGSSVTFNRTSIAWPHDIGLHTNWNTAKQGFDVTEQDWLVWFRPSATKDFFKLYARIQSDLPAGTYTFAFQNLFDISDFGQKYMHLSKSNYVGNKDLFLGIAFLSLGGGCLILLIIFIAKCVTERRQKPKME